TYAKILLFIYRYFCSKNIDLAQRVSDGKYLSKEEYSDFKRNCMFKSDLNSDDNNVVSFAYYSDKQLSNLIHSTKNTEARVSANTAKLRLKQFITYVEYLYNTFHFANNPLESISIAFSDLKRTVKADIRKIKEQNNEVNDPYESAIPDDIYFKMLEIIKPWSNENPFKGSRLRNQLIILLFNDTGIREGALAKLKISDIKMDWSKPHILITRTPNDPTDQRKKKPSQKTKAHASAISKNTLKLLKNYIENERSKFSEASLHDFVFISEKGKCAGKPLTLNSIYKVVGKLSNTLKFHLYPHLFRYKWNEIFDTNATKMGYTAEQIEDIRKYAMSWSEDSKMAAIYNDFKLALKAQELSEIRQGGFINLTGGSDDNERSDQ
uniref:site-specific integrase n=1 Tax=Vibrio sp. V23_P3S9T160 TaxID=1938675 RepID=UPI001F33B4D5